MSGVRRRLLSPLVWCVAALGVVGCEAQPRPLTWSIRFSTPALAARAAVVDARILRDSCTGEEIWGIEIREGDSMTPRPPSLVSGRYCFVASAQDVDCVRYAESTVMVDLPGDTEVINTLIARDPMQICIPPMCRTGACRPPDAGLPDVGMMDVGTMDVPPPDVPGLDVPGLDVPPTPDTSCLAIEMVCDNLRDDDCDGDTDCTDAECGSSTICDACFGISCPECQTCLAGACVNADVLCGGGTCHGGSCCRGCWNGTACSSGTASDVECGAGGGACTSCGECEQCSGGACVAEADGATCSGGRCAAGRCCTGCISGGACIAIPSGPTCGAGGNACMNCGECGLCMGGMCGVMAPGTTCGGGAGRCAGSSCCTGCIDGGGACQTGNFTGACGFGGNRCNTSCPCMGNICGLTSGDRCDTPIDISGGGDFPIDTCSYNDNLALSCNAAGTPDVMVRGTNPGNYFVSISPGFVITYIPYPVASCAPDSFCNVGSNGASGSTPDGAFMWVIERQGGGCGRVHIHVDRT